MTARDDVARSWHDGSDHARDGEPFGGPLCNCWRVADRMLPMLRQAWDEGVRLASRRWLMRADDLLQHNPYRTEEDRHVDQ